MLLSMKNRKSNTLIKIYTVLIVLLPLLSVYSFPGVAALTLGEPILIFCSILVLLSCFNRNSSRKVYTIAPLYWLFVFYVLFISLINTAIVSSYSVTDTLTTSLRLILYTMVIFMLSKDNIDFELLRKVYLLVCFACSLYLIIQFLTGTFFGVYLPSTFSNLKIMYSDYTGTAYNSFLYDSYQRLVFRPSSLFKEPSHLSRYIIYALPIISFKRGTKTRYEKINFALILAAILITRSAMGFLGVGVFLIAWLYANQKTNNMYTRIGGLTVVVILLIASIHFGLIDQAVGRLSVETGSGGARIYRGFSIYSKMPLGFKIFGSGLGNYSAFASQYNITTIYDRVGDSGNNYMNLIATTLVSSGVIGLIIHMSSLVKLVWKKSSSQIICFLLFAFFAFGTNIYYYSAEYILPVLFMIYDINSSVYANEAHQGI